MGVVKFTRENIRGEATQATRNESDLQDVPPITEAELLARLHSILTRKQTKTRRRTPSPVSVIARSVQRTSPATRLGATQLNPFDMIAEWLGALQAHAHPNKTETIIAIQRAVPQYDEGSAELPSDRPAALDDRPATPTAVQTLPSEPPGDPAFWGAWIEHHDQMKRLALSLMRGNQADAEDALSAAMLRAHKSYDANQIRNPAAWFNRLVRNSCIDLYRLRAKSPSYAEPQEDTTATFGEASPHFPKTKSSEEELLSNEGLFETMAHIFELPEDLMEPLLLRCLAERPYEDIAVAMGLSNAAVRKRVQLGRRYLQETMSQQE